ncbi:MAG: hypothetical protein GX168_12570 [Bacteroidales bacterium]|jgi:hypothetical protein|nr:hypothetical protein [Bacteroidales bacterium]
MDHVVYLDHKAKELENLKKGIKTMLIRGAMGRKFPYGKVETGEQLYFIENKGDGLIKASATVAAVINAGPLGSEESMALIQAHQDKLLLNGGLLKRFGGKRYLVLITIKDFQETENFKIDRSAYGNMDDWLPVGDIEKVRAL